MKFSENLRRIRKDKEYSQEYLAEKMSVSRQTISKWENGTAMPDLKKLTELAELFEVSMDDLLGIETGENYDKCSPSSDDKISAEHIQQIIYTINESQNKAYQKKIKTYIFTLLIAVCAVLILLIVINSSLFSQINNLQNQINSISTQKITIDNYSTDPDYDDYTSYSIKRVYADKPYIVQTEFKYSPNEYPKNPNIYFTIPLTDGSTMRIDAQENNGEFTALADIDITLVDNEKTCYTCVDDGTNIARYEFYADFICDYRNLQYNTTLEYTYSRGSCIILNCTGENLTWQSGTAGEITEAYFACDNGNETIYSKPLEIKKMNSNNTSDDRTIIIPNEIKIDNVKTFEKMYFKLIDENGVELRYYPVQYNSDESDSGNDDDIIQLIFNKNGKSITLKTYA